MTTKPEKSDRSYTEAVIRLKDGYLVGLNAVEARILNNLLGGLLSTGRLSTEGTQITHNIYQRLNESLNSSEPSSSASSLLQQNRELRRRLIELRRKLNRLEDEMEAKLNELEDELEVGETLV